MKPLLRPILVGAYGGILRFQIDRQEVYVTGPGDLRGWLRVSLATPRHGLVTIGVVFHTGSSWRAADLEFDRPELACGLLLQRHRESCPDPPAAVPSLLLLAVVLWLCYQLYLWSAPL